MRRLGSSVATLLCLVGAITCTCQERGARAAEGALVAPSGEGGRTTTEAAVAAAPDAPGPRARLEPRHLRYQGAFRLPDEFAWGARGMSYYPGGDGGAGTLLITGFELSRTEDGGECHEGAACVALFGEVRIPTPKIADRVEGLPMAELSRPMTGFDGGKVHALHEYTWVSGIEFVPGAGDRDADRIYGSLNLWYAEGVKGEETFPTIWAADLDGSNPVGLFHVGPERPPFHGRKMGDYLFRVPRWYADRYLGGRTLVTGRARGTPADGSERETTRGGSQGPTLFAFHPLRGRGLPPHLDAIPILFYRVRFPGCAGPNVGEPDSCDYPGYTMCDIWTGAAFVEGPSGRAILLAGYKGLGSNCYDEPPVSCSDPCSDDHGYHCQPYERQVIFYDVDQLGRAALGEVEHWSVLPYHTWRPAEFLIDGQACWTLGGMAFDASSRRLFIVERGLGGSDSNAAAVHVWTVD